MILTQHGINSLSRGPKDVFFEFLSSVVSSDMAGKLKTVAYNGVTYEYIDDNFGTWIRYYLDKPVDIIEFDIYWNTNVVACNLGPMPTLQSRLHRDFMSVRYPPLLTRFGTTNYDSIDFPAYSYLNGSMYYQYNAGAPREYCKEIIANDSTSMGHKHYKYEFINSTQAKVTVTYAKNKTASALFTFSSIINNSYIGFMLEYSSNRSDFAFKNFRILYK